MENGIVDIDVTLKKPVNCETFIEILKNAAFELGYKGEFENVHRCKYTEQYVIGKDGINCMSPSLYPIYKDIELNLSMAGIELNISFEKNETVDAFSVSIPVFSNANKKTIETYLRTASKYFPR